MQNFLPPNMKLPAVKTRTALDREFLNVSTQEGADEFLRQMRNDGKPPFSRDILVTINQRIHNQPEDFIDHKSLMKKYANYVRNPSEWWKNSMIRFYCIMITICSNASKDLLKESMTDIELRIILNHLVSMVKLSISRDNRGVKITEQMLHSSMGLLIPLFFMLDASHDIIRDFLKSLANAVKGAKKKTPLDSGVGYALCHAMVQCFIYFDRHEDYNEIKALGTIEKSNILEQVLRHIHLPWIDLYGPESKELILRFFGELGNSPTSLRKIFKEGSSNREVLLDILEGRLQPCRENEFVMDLLLSLKTLCDMSSLDTLKKEYPNGAYVSTLKSRCSKCEKVNMEQELLVCSNCKYTAYCSHECQKADWKEHKGICRQYQTVKFKNLSEVFENFVVKHHNLLAERVRNKCLETGLESTQFILDLDFTSSSGQVPPALRDPPEFELLPASIFWNREEDKAPDHWFFRETMYTESRIMKIRKDVLSKQEDVAKMGQHFVFVFNNFSEYQWLSACRLPKEEGYLGTYGYQHRRKMAIEEHMENMRVNEEINEEIKHMSELEKEEHFRESEWMLGTLFDMMSMVIQKDGTTTSPDLVENEGEDEYNASTDM